MERFTKHTGKAVSILDSNIDTDQIIPKQFLKRIERTGYGKFLFYDRRFFADGTVNSDFVLNDPRYAGASILIAGANFGCGSSREHAPWSLLDFGFRVVIAQSFGDIFYSNSLKTGLLPIRLRAGEINTLDQRLKTQSDYLITVDLENRSVSDSKSLSITFDIDEFSRHCLFNGLDDIALSLQYEDKITAHEENLKDWHI
jgi:3-isopropylmalate/(R)-2-methylmalate dehydratase small subunit